MSNGQNTGRRYIPKFFTYDGSTEWRPNVAYSAKTIVTRNFKVYTSIVNVPSNVGAPEDNPKYWQPAVITDEVMQTIIDELGKLDGDVSEVEHRVEVIENEVGELEVVIGDVQDDVDGLKNNLEATQIVDSASGAIASFPDGGDGFPVRDLKVQLEPVQDLHGYANPWPAGGGKNKFKVTAESQTAYGVTFTVNDDGSIATSGTATDTGNITLGTFTPTDTYILNGCPSGGGGSRYLLRFVGDSTYSDTGSGVNIPSGNTGNVIIYVVNGTNMDGKVFYPMIRLATETDATFVPYSNVCPISGRTAVTVTRTGFNVWDEEWEVGDLSNSGQPITASDRIRTKNFIHVIPSTAYYFKTGVSGQTSWQLFGCCYDEHKNFISTFYKRNDGLTMPSNCHYIKWATTGGYGTTYNHDISINYPLTDHDYHAGHVQTVEIPLGQTVYGGTLDVTNGTLTVDMAQMVLDGTQSIAVPNWRSSETSVGWLYSAGVITPKKPTSEYYVANAKCDKLEVQNYHDTYYGAYDNGICITHDGATYPIAVRLSDTTLTTISAINAYLAENPITLVYEVATPVTVQLTAQQITTLLGQNNVWSDADSVSVDYVADTKLYTEKELETVNVLRLSIAPVEDGTTASQAYAQGKYFFHNGDFCKAKTDIASGATFTLNTNYEVTTVAAELFSALS